MSPTVAVMGEQRPRCPWSDEAGRRCLLQEGHALLIPAPHHVPNRLASSGRRILFPTGEFVWTP